MGGQICRLGEVIDPSWYPLLDSHRRAVDCVHHPAGSFIRSRRLPMTRSSSLVIIPRHWTYLRSCVEVKSASRQIHFPLNFLHIVRKVWIFPLGWDHDNHEASKTRRSV